LRRQTIEITVSIGVSSFPEDASVEEDLIKAADERLYRAKAEGRNRVCAS
jgi:diguanylate cyclase (GGDEF)-like protein